MCASFTRQRKPCPHTDQIFIQLHTVPGQDFWSIFCTMVPWASLRGDCRNPLRNCSRVSELKVPGTSISHTSYGPTQIWRWTLDKTEMNIGGLLFPVFHRAHAGTRCQLQVAQVRLQGACSAVIQGTEKSELNVLLFVAFWAAKTQLLGYCLLQWGMGICILGKKEKTWW